MMGSLLFRAFYKIPTSRRVTVTSVFVANEFQIFDEWFNHSQGSDPDENVHNWFRGHSHDGRTADVTNFQRRLSHQFLKKLFFGTKVFCPFGIVGYYSHDRPM